MENNLGNESAEGQHILNSGKPDNFQDLEAGKIDIFDFVLSTPGSSSETLVEDHRQDANIMDAAAAAAAAAVGSRYGVVNGDHMHQVHQQHLHVMTNGSHGMQQPPASLQHHHTVAAAGVLRQSGTHGPAGAALMMMPGMAAAQHLHRLSGAGITASGHVPSFQTSVQAAHQAQRLISYDPQVRLPDSPPETDSGPASAGSPSGSEASPYSPDFHNFHSGHMQGSVIVAGNGGTLQSSSAHHHGQQQQPGVILNVHGLDANYADYVLPVQPNNRVAANGNNVLNSPLANTEFFANQATPSVQHSPYILPAANHNGYSQTEPMSRKRPRSDVQFVKPEPSSPPIVPGNEENIFYEEGSSHHNIKFSDYQTEGWHRLCDEYGRELKSIGMCVVADKGFNYLPQECAFVNQKKNHFQVTTNIEIRDRLEPKFVKTSTGELKPLSHFELDFYGIKAESPNFTIKIKQSSTERKPVVYVPIEVNPPPQPNKATKVTVARLHFSETTNNNMRKHSRPNPEQRYFCLVASLNVAVRGNETEKYVVMAQSSEKVIVRASNPGQFENGESDVHWQKGQNNSIFHSGPVGINTDSPTVPLTVGGDILCFGNVTHPSDQRLKENITNVNPLEALDQLRQVRLVYYDYKPDAAEEFGLSEDERCGKVGVVAQEVDVVFPKAVKEKGEFKSVDNDTIFYHGVAALQGLTSVTDHMGNQISKLTKWAKGVPKQNAIRRFDSITTNGSISNGYMSGSQSTLNQPPEKHHLQEKSDKCAASEENCDDKAKCTRSFNTHCDHYHHMVCAKFSGHQSSLCSNKPIQTTIVVLVLVMAFCLLAMIALYAMEWHKRNSLGGVVIAPHYYYPAETIKPPTRKGGIGLMSINITARPPKIPAFLPPPPLNGRCKHLHCDKFCCGQLSYSLHLLPVKNSKVAAARLDAAQLDPERSVAARLILVKETAEWAGSKYRYPRKISSFIELDNSSAEKSRLKYDVVRKYEEKKQPVIRLLGSDNITLDYRYCMADNCMDPKRGNFTFYVPISSYMPHMPINVKFETLPEDQVAFCRHDIGQLCLGLAVSSSDLMPNDSRVLTKYGQVQQRNTRTWELPVGYFLDSLYTFRVGTSTTLCSLPADDSGASFIEYNIWFYRVCQ